MPQFSPGSAHKAIATFKNPKTAGFDYSASLCMGTGWTEMASASFHLNAGESKAIEFPVTMPATVGTYPVYFKVTSGGVLIGTFAATEDVVIAAVAVILDFSNISVYGICLVKFSSIGVDPDGVPFGVLKDGLNITSLQRLSVQWRDKTVVFGVGYGGADGMDAIDGGFMVSFLDWGGMHVIDLAPVFFGWSNIQGSPARPFDASALLRYVIGTGSWTPGYYDAEFEFMIFFDRADKYSAWTYPPRFRVKGFMYCNTGGSVS